MNLPPLIEVPKGTPPFAVVVIALDVVRETDKAVQVTRDRWSFDARTAWLPKSKVVRMSPLKGETQERFRIPVWMWSRVREQLREDGEA